MEIYPPELIVSQETGTSLRDLERMGKDKMMYYYYFILKKKEKELKEMESAQDKNNQGNKSISFKTSPPKGYKSWEEWERKMLTRDKKN